MMTESRTLKKEDADWFCRKIQAAGKVDGAWCYYGGDPEPDCRICCRYGRNVVILGWGDSWAEAIDRAANALGLVGVHRSHLPPDDRTEGTR